MTNPDTKFEDATIIRSWVTSYNGSRWLLLKCVCGHCACAESRDPSVGILASVAVAQTLSHLWTVVFVVWPTMSCFADCSKRLHVTLRIIVCPPVWRHRRMTIYCHPAVTSPEGDSKLSPPGDVTPVWVVTQPRPGGNRTRDLLITSQTPYHCATTPPSTFTKSNGGLL